MAAPTVKARSLLTTQGKVMPTSQVGGANAGQRDVQVSETSFGAGFGDARTRGGIEPPWVRGRLTASVSVHCTETDALLPAHFVNAIYG